MPRHRQGFPCCVQSPLPYMPPPIPRRNRSVLASLTSRPLAAFPFLRQGSASALSVSGPARRLLALWPVWSLSRPRRPFVIGVLQTMLLPPSSAPTATGWSDSCRAGFAPAEDSHLLTAHRRITLRVDFRGFPGAGAGRSNLDHHRPEGSCAPAKRCRRESRVALRALMPAQAVLKPLARLKNDGSGSETVQNK